MDEQTFEYSLDYALQLDAEDSLAKYQAEFYKKRGSSILMGIR